MYIYIYIINAKSIFSMKSLQCSHSVWNGKMICTERQRETDIQKDRQIETVIDR